MLDHQEQLALLRLARETIAAALEKRERRRPDQLTPRLIEPGAAFVSLHRDGDLRGCIGSIIAVSPLWEAVASSAVSAAFRDPRFEPLRPEELALIDLEISVMTPMERVKNLPDDVVVGRDGLMISFGAQRGLLLPQVASEYGWDAQTFLDQTCVKAGLARGTWQDPQCVVEKFTAQVFGEKHLNLK